MAHAGQELGGDAFRLRLIETGAETDGALLEMEAYYAGTAGMPPMHFHPRQAERFEVLEGALQTVIDGAERRYEAGEVFEVPAGVPHQMAAEGPTKTLWQVRPALRTADFFERLLGGSVGEDYLAFLEEFREEIRFPEAERGR